MKYLERISEDNHSALYVDLFVRPSNAIALKMYQSLGYQVYQTVDRYYCASSGESAEDALDLRRSLRGDPAGALSVPTHKKIKPSELPFH
jgi:N-terminal acetyltransferase B complex catalytic subunit